MYKSELTIDDVIDILEEILSRGNSSKVHFRTKNGEKRTAFIRN